MDMAIGPLCVRDERGSEREGEPHPGEEVFMGRLMCPEEMKRPFITTQRRKVEVDVVRV